MNIIADSLIFNHFPSTLQKLYLWKNAISFDTEQYKDRIFDTGVDRLDKDLTIGQMQGMMSQIS